MSRPARVLFDATALVGYSGTRGIGQMVSALLLGMEATRAEWEGQLDITVLCALSPFGNSVVSSDLTQCVEAARRSPRASEPSLAFARRLHLSRAAAGFDLVYQPEALGTPLWDAVPRVVTCYDMIPLRMQGDYLPIPGQAAMARMAARRRFRTPTGVVCISNRTRDDLLSIVGVSRESVCVVPCGIESRRWARPLPVPEQEVLLKNWGLQGRPFLVYAGAADARKNVAGMMRTVRELAERGTPTDLAWAGGLERVARQQVLRAAREAGVADRVRLLGFVADSDMPTLFQRAAAHLFLSRLEGFGLTVLEALAARCPVVVAEGSGADEAGGDAVLRVGPDDPKAAADAVISLLNSPTKREQLRELGVAVAARSTAEVMARGYVDAWQSTLRQTRAK